MRRYAVLAVGLVVVAACSHAAELSVERIAEADPAIQDVSIGDGKVNVEFTEDEGGGSLVIGGGEIPADAPLPVPGGGDVTTSLSQAGTFGAAIRFEPDRFEEIVGFYLTWVESIDATGLNEVQTVNPMMHGWSGTVDGADVGVSIIGGVDGVDVVLSWEE